MKVKTTKKEIRECVQNAMMRVIKENRYEDEQPKKKTPKHCKLKPQSKKGGNKGNFRFDDDEY